MNTYDEYLTQQAGHIIEIQDAMDIYSKINHQLTNDN